MKFKSVIASNHDLKKNGYKIIGKLHKLELRKNFCRAYSASCSEGYFFVLSCSNLIGLVISEYDKTQVGTMMDVFIRKSNSFLNHLIDISNSKTTIDKRRLSAYLTTYTEFFNYLIENNVHFNISQKMLVEWNVRCVTAYIAVWGGR